MTPRSRKGDLQGGGGPDTRQWPESKTRGQKEKGACLRNGATGGCCPCAVSHSFQTVQSDALFRPPPGFLILPSPKDKTFGPGGRGEVLCTSPATTQPSRFEEVTPASQRYDPPPGPKCDAGQGTVPHAPKHQVPRRSGGRMGRGGRGVSEGYFVLPNPRVLELRTGPSGPPSAPPGTPQN